MHHHSPAAQRAARSFWGVMGSSLFVVSGVTLVWLLENRQTPPMTIIEACLMMMRQVWSTPLQLATSFSFAGLLVSLLGLSGAWAAWRSLAAWWHTRRLLVRSQPYHPGRWSALDTALATLPPLQQRVRILDTMHPVACTVGFWQPQIVLSTDLMAGLSAAELRAVLGHEWGHVHRRDPLRLALLRFCSSALWFLPIVRALAQDSGRSMEDAADDAAVVLTEQPFDLAAALVKTAKAQAQPRWAPLPALGGIHTVTERVERLLDGVPTRHRQRHDRAWTISTAVVIALFGLLILSRHAGIAAAPVPPLSAQSPVLACPMHRSQG